MSIRLVCSALIIGALTTVTVPQNLSVAQSNDQGASAPESATPNRNMTPHKHRYWRHSGGRHPHYGSRRVRTHPSKETASPPSTLMRTGNHPKDKRVGLWSPRSD
jgi:hypothetical protein